MAEQEFLGELVEDALLVLREVKTAAKLALPPERRAQSATERRMARAVLKAITILERDADQFPWTK